MKIHSRSWLFSFIMAASVALPGCRHPAIEVPLIRYGPTTLLVEVLSVHFVKQPTGGDACRVTLKNLDPKTETKNITIILSDIDGQNDQFLVLHSRWRIHASQDLMDQQRSPGF